MVFMCHEPVIFAGMNEPMRAYFTPPKAFGASIWSFDTRVLRSDAEARSPHLVCFPRDRPADDL